MSYRPAEAKAVSTSFQSFLWMAISKIWEAEDEGDSVLALDRACCLVKYLPEGIKKQLEGNVEQITVLINKNFGVKSNSGFFSTMQLRNKSINTAAKTYLQALMNKLTRLLDERGIYMEYKRREIPTNVSQEVYDQLPH